MLGTVTWLIGLNNSQNQSYFKMYMKLVHVLSVVSLSKAHLLPTVLVKPRKRWLRPDMTEKLLTGTLSLNTNKQTSTCTVILILMKESKLLPK